MSSISTNIEAVKKILQGGVKKVYLFPYVKYSRSQIILDNQHVQSFPYTNIYYYYSNATNFAENTEVEGGDVLWNQNLSLQIPKTIPQSEVYKLVKQNFRAIYIDNIGNIRILGLFNGLEATITNETGSSKPEFNGYKINLTGKEDNQAYFLNNLNDFNIYSLNNNFIFEEGCNFVFEDGENFIFND